MKSTWDQQQVVAANLSRAMIPGNRQSVAAFMSAMGGSEASGPTTNTNPQSNQVVYAPPVAVKTQTDFSQGQLVPTGDPLQLAIEGSGLFKVRDKSGTITYTRNGDFHWNPDGRITANDGSELVGEGNTPISVPSTKGMRIDEAGSVFVEEQAAGKISLAHFKSPANDLRELANGRFAKKDGVSDSAPAAEPDQIRAGYLENSNSSPISQMVTMIDVMRAYEANQKMVATADEAIGKMIKAAGV